MSKIKNIKQKQSQAKKINILLKKYEKTFKSYTELANFKEPVLMLMRRNRRIEFFEEATQGKFAFKHSDGEERKIILDPTFMNTFDYGKKVFKGYICHEDFPTPLPEDPVVTSEIFGMSIDKTLHDRRAWEAERMKATGDMIWKIALGIGLVIGVAVIGYTLAPDFFDKFFNKGTADLVMGLTK